MSPHAGRALPHVVSLALACALLISALGMPGAALAQLAPGIAAHAAFDPPSASIGDRVTLSVVVRHPDNVILKASTPALADVDVVTVIPPTTATGTPAGEAAASLPGSTTHVTTFAYTLQPFVLGTVDTGPIQLSWLRADGSVGTVDVAPAQLVVAPVRAAEDEALRPIKPQVSIEGAPSPAVRPATAATLVTVLVLAIGLVMVLRKRRTTPVEVTAPADMSPERGARDALDALGPVLAARLDYESYYGGLALTVRTYLAARFGFNAHALTTTELERRMVSHGVDRWQARLVGGLLERCDDAVYGHRYPEPASADHDLTVAYEIVELSRPSAPTEGGAMLV